MSTTPSSLFLVAALNPSVVGGWALVALRQIAVRAGRNGVIRDQRGQSCLPVHARPAPKADLVLVYFRQALSRNQTPAAALRHPPTSGDHGGGDPLTSSVIGQEPRLSGERALRNSCQRPRPTSSSDEVEVAPAPPHEPGIFNMRRRSLRHSLFVAAGIGGSTAFSIESAGDVRGRPSNFGEIPRIISVLKFPMSISGSD
jgi:hypothetical protein